MTSRDISSNSRAHRTPIEDRKPTEPFSPRPLNFTCTPRGLSAIPVLLRGHMAMPTLRSFPFNGRFDGTKFQANFPLFSIGNIIDYCQVTSWIACGLSWPQ